MFGNFGICQTGRARLRGIDRQRRLADAGRHAGLDQGIAPAYRATYPFTRWEGPNWSEIGSMLRLGLPIGVTHFAEVSAFGVVSLLVARFGVVQVSAHQIALNFIVAGVHGAAQLWHRRCSPASASRWAKAIRPRRASWPGSAPACAAFGVLSALGIALFRWQIAAHVHLRPGGTGTCAHLLLLAALFQLSDSTQVAAASCAIRGYKVTRSPMVIQMIAFWGVACRSGWILGWRRPGSRGRRRADGGTGFWIGLVLGLTVAACC
jgi:MATE family multidrug resistance protein